MADSFAELPLTATVTAALRLASTRRLDGRSLDTQTVLRALESVDSDGDWSRLLITDLQQNEAEGSSTGTWESVPLTQQCAAALSRAKIIADAYDLKPLPVGALALALVWDAESGAAKACIGITHADLVHEVQRELLGVELNGLTEVLARPAVGRVDGQERITPHGVNQPPGSGQSAQITEAEAMRSLARVVPRLSSWTLRLLALAAIAGAVFGVIANPAWTFQVKDDLAPPIARPAIAAAIPGAAAISTVLGTEVVVVRDSLPSGVKIFDSALPFWYDVRTQEISGDWTTELHSTDGRSDVFIQIVRIKTPQPLPLAPNSCQPQASQAAASNSHVLRSGYMSRDSDSAAYCSEAFDKQTQILVGIDSSDPHVLARIAADVATIEQAVDQALPAPQFVVTDGIPTPYSTAELNRGLIAATLGLVLFWTLPTLLFDRASWQRLWWTLSLKRFWTRALPGIDVDGAVRARLWSAVALSTTQLCAAIWMLRLINHQGIVTTAISVVAVVLAISMVPRLLYLRRAGRSLVPAVRRRTFWLLGTLSCVLAVAFAMLVMWMANALSTIGTNLPDYEQQRISAFFDLMSIPAALLAVAPSMLLRRIAMRTLRKQPMSDKDRPILLLRSFADDGRRLRARASHRRALVDRLSLRRWERFEEIIAASLGTHGPVFAVGQLGERLPPPLGAVRRQFTDKEWRSRVSEIMAGASVICVTVGRSTALEWEIQEIARLGFLPKTIFVVPPTKRSEHVKRLAVLAAALRVNWADLNVTPTGSWALAIRVPAVGAQPQIFRARAQEDVGYDIAVELASLAVRGFALPALPSASAAKVSGPSPEIYATGKTPTFKPILRRGWVRWMMIVHASAITALLVAFLTGEPQDTTSVITLNSGFGWAAMAADGTTSQLYGLVNGVLLTKLDFSNNTVTRVRMIDAADDLVADAGWLYASNDATGTLQAIDPGAKRIVWTLQGLTGVRSIVATDKVVYLLLPAARQVRVIDRRSGATLATETVNGIPWASALSNHDLFVSLINSSSVVELDGQSLTELGRSPSGADTTQLAAAAGTVWAYSASKHAVLAIDGPYRGDVIYTRSHDPHIGSNGSVLAIEGVEQMTTLWPDGDLRRNRLSTEHSQSLAVTAAGDVLAAKDDQALLIRTSKV